MLGPTEQLAPARRINVLLTVFGLCGLAVTQPLLDVLGRGPTFFVAHRSDGVDVLVFLAVVTVLPTAFVGGLLLVAHGISPASWRWAVPVAFGALAALIVVPHLDRALGLPTAVFGVLVLSVAALVAVGLRARPRIVPHLSALAIAPVVVVGAFVFTSPAAQLVVHGSTVDSLAARERTDLVMLVFDELPLGALLDRSGDIDAVRYPGFARLAAESTWYRNTSTVSPWTYEAVPALLTGALPYDKPIASEANYPRNIFRLLGASHELRVHESITQLCGTAECADDDDREARLLYRDAAIVYLHTLLPDDVAADRLPPLGDRWADFEGRASTPLRSLTEPAEPAAASDNEPTEAVEGTPLERMAASLAAPPSNRPVFTFGHFLVPHTPYRYVPDGRTYPSPPYLAGTYSQNAYWGDDEALIAVGLQRFALQLKYVDSVIATVLDAIERSPRSDSTMLVVTSDHGVSFRANGHRRGLPLDEHTVTDVLPVPLFVRYPGQQAGRVDDAPHQSIDVMPTIASELDVALPSDWTFDGRPLDDTRLRERTFLSGDGVQPPLELDLGAAAAPFLDLLGEGRAEHDVFAWGPHADLVGAALDASAAGVGGRRATLLDPEIRQPGATDDVVPAYVSVALPGVEPGSRWCVIALNGTIAGISPVHGGEYGPIASIMVDPALIESTNGVAVALVDDAGALELLELTG